MKQKSDPIYFSMEIHMYPISGSSRKVVDMSSVDSLIEKFKSGLEVKILTLVQNDTCIYLSFVFIYLQLKDLKSSEIIEIYEHKLQAMSVRSWK